MTRSRRASTGRSGRWARSSSLTFSPSSTSCTQSSTMSCRTRGLLILPLLLCSASTSRRHLRSPGRRASRPPRRSYRPRKSRSRHNQERRLHLLLRREEAAVWSSGCVALLWQRSWAVSSDLVYPRRPHDRSSGSPLSEHTHVPQFSVRAGRGTPPRTGHAPSHTSPPPELTPAESAHYKTNKSSTHKYKTYNQCIGKYKKVPIRNRVNTYTWYC